MRKTPADRVRPGAVALTGLVVLALTGCGGKRIVQGVYHSPKGYRVVVPSAQWQVVESRRADLELRHAASRAGILVHASCQPETLRRSFDVLQRQLLAGLRERAVTEQEILTLNGRPAAHAVLEGQLDGQPGRVEVEAYVVKGDRCVYDVLYAASPEAFAGGRDDFRRVVESLEAE